MLTEVDLPAFPKTVAALHFGSISLVAEPCGSALEALMKREQKDRVLTLDPNIRPTLVHNRDGYMARLDRLVAMVDIARLSEDDLAWIAPDASFETLGRRWLDLGARMVILTRGAEGATAITASHAVSVPGIAAKVVDTVGAGDTFTAGILARLDALGLLTKKAVANLDRERLTDVLTFATKAAAVTVFARRRRSAVAEGDRLSGVPVLPAACGAACTATRFVRWLAQRVTPERP